MQFLVFVLSASIYIFLAAVSPQESDGAEIAYQALNAGVLHPPGFPLYSLLSIPLVKIFSANPYHTLAIFSAVSQALAGMFIYKIARLFSTSQLLGFSIALAWLFFPATMRTATDAEVFALSNLLLTATSFYSLKLLRTDLVSARQLFILGGLIGLGWSNHHMVIFFFPLFIAPLFVHFSKRKLLSTSLGVFLGCLPYLYLIYRIYVPSNTLYFPLENLSDFWSYVTRAGYGTFSLKSGDSSDDISYIWDFLRLVLFFVTFCALGVFLKKHRIPIILTLLFNVWFLSKLIYPPETEIYSELLMRFYPGVLLAFMLPAIVVVSAFKRKQLLMLLLVLLPILYRFDYKLELANSRQDKITDLEIRQILKELPQDAVFISSLDRLSSGIPYYQQLYDMRPDVQVVVQGFLGLESYRKNLLAQLRGERPIHAYLETPISSGLKAIPYGLTWEWVPISSIKQNNTVLEYCKNLPKELTYVSSARSNSKRIKEVFLLSCR